MNERGGVLILSERTGARQQLEPGALIIPPLDVYATAEAMHQALTMPVGERQERAERLRYLDQVGTDPGAVVGAIEALLGLALPALLLRRGERLAGYVALAMFALVAVVALAPIIAILRALAHRF